ncbi:MAG: menaquinone biosynthetic enzyme MqnA/MqnD family protein [Planctomycetota bacterium]|jgi:predicted solute-binding protein
MFTLGVVPYLNAQPLLVGLEGRARLVEAVPSRLSALLVAGEVDVALLPVAEAARGVGDGYVGNFGIVSEGAVGSVLLFLRRPLAAVESVLLDPSSRSSAALLRFLLAQAGRTDVSFVEAPRPAPDPTTAKEHAVLLIGDPALERAETWTDDLLDLGEAWTEQTGLPFVYARWTARSGLSRGDREALAALLDEAGAAGRACREEIARTWARARGEDEEAAVRYLLHNVHCTIGEREREGLARFEAVVREQEAARQREARHA